MATYRHLDKEFGHLSDMIAILRTQAFNLSISASSGNESVSDGQFNDLCNRLAEINKYAKDIKRWIDELESAKS